MFFLDWGGGEKKSTALFWKKWCTTTDILLVYINIYNIYTHVLGISNGNR